MSLAVVSLQSAPEVVEDVVVKVLAQGEPVWVGLGSHLVFHKPPFSWIHALEPLWELFQV